MKSFVMGSAGALAMVVLLVGVAVAADIFTVDRNGVVRFGISDTGAARLTAADNSSPALNVTQSGTGPSAVFSGGNVGIGTTGPLAPLHVADRITSSRFGDVLAANAYYDGTGWKFVGNFPAWNLGGWSGDGTEFRIMTSPSGTAGSSITWNVPFAVKSGNVGIGTTSPGASNLLELSSTSKGLVMPRMTKAQRNAIASPVAGMQIYQTDNTPGVRIHNGTNWMRYTESID